MWNIQNLMQKIQYKVYNAQYTIQMIEGKNAYTIINNKIQSIYQKANDTMHIENAQNKKHTIQNEMNTVQCMKYNALNTKHKIQLK